MVISVSEWHTEINQIQTDCSLGRTLLLGQVLPTDNENGLIQGKASGSDCRPGFKQVPLPQEVRKKLLFVLTFKQRLGGFI